MHVRTTYVCTQYRTEQFLRSHFILPSLFFLILLYYFDIHVRFLLNSMLYASCNSMAVLQNNDRLGSSVSIKFEFFELNLPSHNCLVIMSYTTSDAVSCMWCI